MDESPESMPRGVGSRILNRIRGWRPRHRVSLFLMVAMAVVLFLGVEVVKVRDDPKGLAWFLVLFFIFFFMVIGRALFEIMDIAREHMRERESAFRTTFAQEEFSSELGRRVGKSEAESWPE